MKNLLLVALLLVPILDCQAQSFIPLKIDSIYTWSWHIGFEGEVDTSENFAAYTYDSNDSLIHSRHPSLRASYTYAQDTVFSLVETLGANQIWAPTSRHTTVYENGVVITKLTEQFVNDEWENSALYAYAYNTSGKEAQSILLHWKNGAWVNFLKRESIYDAKGNKIEESEYFTDEDGVFKFNNGDLYQYDDANHRTQRIHINSGINGPYYTGEENWFYGDDDLLDAYERCHYSGQSCRNVILLTYDYHGEDTIVQSGFTWDDDHWKYYGQTLTFAGPGIYSNEPDSVIYYEYRVEDLTHVPMTRRYLSYTDLGNQTIYFKDVTFKFLGQAWEFTNLKEEWYHIQNSVSVWPMTSSKESAILYPNPCISGQLLQIHIDHVGEDPFEVLVFDLHGRLVLIQQANTTATFSAPQHTGIYTVFFRTQSRLIGTAKLVVAE